MLIRTWLAFVVGAAATAVAISGVPVHGQGALQPARSVTNNVITSAADPAVRIRVHSSFRYVGGQRFVLLGVADAEQHVFVDAPDGHSVKRLYWIQFEQYLPGRGGAYDYASDSAVSRWGLPLRVQVRRSAGQARAGSDRQHMLELLHRSGLDAPASSVHARLVYVPETNRRQELMIIYLEPAGAGDPTPGERDALIDRALTNLEIIR